MDLSGIYIFIFVYIRINNYCFSYDCPSVTYKPKANCIKIRGYIYCWHNQKKVSEYSASSFSYPRNDRVEPCIGMTNFTSMLLFPLDVTSPASQADGFSRLPLQLSGGRRRYVLKTAEE